MNETDNAGNRVDEAVTGTKQPWITPAATVEQVSELTQITGGGVGDGASCHT